MTEKDQLALRDLTRGLTEEQVRDFVCYLVVYDLDNGEVLMTEGEHTESLFIVHTGWLSIVVGQDQKAIEVAKIRSGGWVGEVAMLDPGPASATVKVFVKAKVLELTHQALLDLMKDHPSSAHCLLENLSLSLAERLQKTSNAMISKDQWKLRLTQPGPKTKSWFQSTLKGTVKRASA